TDHISSVSGTVTANGFGTESIYVDGRSATSLTANRWHHVAITTDTGLSGSTIKIGQISSNFGQMFIDEVKFYNYARSVDQIEEDYNKGSAAKLGSYDQKFLSDGLVGYWKMDETSWTNN